MILNILPVLLIGVFFYKSSLKQNGCCFTHLSKEVSLSLKGFFAFVVLFHHLSQRVVNSGALFSLFEDAGYLAVAIFFFLSGYGLQKQKMIRGESYRKHFFRKRVLGIVLPYGVVIILQWINNRMMGYYYSPKAVLNAMFVGDHPMMVLYSWYVLVILAFYVIYGLLLYAVPVNNKMRIGIITVANVIYVALAFTHGLGTYWFNVVHVLLLGIVWAVYEEQIVNYLQNKFTICYGALGIIFISMYSFIRLNGELLAQNPFMDYVIKALSAVVFVIIILMTIMKVNIGNKLLFFCGKISLEIYLIQGVFISGLGHYIYIKNEELWILAVIVATIIGAVGLHIIDNTIKKIVSA